MESENQLGVLAKALVEVQKKLVPVKKNKENPFYKSHYSDLVAVWESCKKELADNGFAFTQSTGFIGDRFVLTTSLLHVSGGVLSGNYWINCEKMTDPQKLGSAITYSRRYALCALVGIVCEDEDDDGNSAAHHEAVKHDAPKKEYPKQETGGEQKNFTPRNPSAPISEKQGKLLYAKWKSAGRADEEVKSYLKTKYGLDSTKQISQGIFQDVLNWVDSKPIEDEISQEEFA